MPLKLKGVMLRHGISHSELAESLKQKHRAFSGRPFSRTSVVKMLNGGWRPARTPWAEIQAATEAFLREAGVPDEAIAEVWDEDVVPHFSTKPLNRRMGEPRGDNNNDDDAVEIEAEMLSSQAKKHFNLFRDPFVDDVQGPEDLFLSADQRYVREAMYQAARQVERALIESSRSGMSHVLMIEEAHDLNIQTLKYLKRFWEMEDGFKKLLSIVLIGQPELREKLNERQYFEAREVIRRCEIVELMPLDGNVGDYLALKMRRIGSALEALLEADAVDAIRTHPALLRTGRGPSRNQTVSLVYPLVVNNLVTKALNRAAYLGAPQVTADIVRGC